MTITQKQCLLTYLGYDTGGVDGVWGDKSRQATEKFQKDYSLEPDGVFGDATMARIKEVIASGEQSVVAENATTIPADENKAEEYLQADGCYHIPRGVEVQLTRNFWGERNPLSGVRLLHGICNQQTDYGFSTGDSRRHRGAPVHCRCWRVWVQVPVTQCGNQGSGQELAAHNFRCARPPLS